MPNKDLAKKQPHKLKNGGTAHVLTENDREKSLQVRRHKAELRRKRAEEVFEGKAVAALRQAAEVYIEGMKADEVRGDGLTADHKTRIQAADRIVDRVLGKPLQRSETHVDGRVEVDVEAKLLALLARTDETA